MSTQPLEALSGHCLDCRRPLTEDERAHGRGVCADCRRTRHAKRTGTPIDEKGRLVVAMPDPTVDVDVAYTGSPDDVIASEDARATRRDANADIDRLMREVPGGRTEGGGSGGGRNKRKPSPRPDRTKMNVTSIEMRDQRPCAVSGRVSVEARDGIYAPGNPSPGEMLDAIGRALRRGVPWQKIGDVIDGLR